MSRRDPLPGSIRLLFGPGTVAGMSDGELLDRFLDRSRVGPRAAEIAFEALVDRHGSMVLRVCRARLGDEHEAQDAFQATFLILARKARSIRDRDSAASWLQGVARRVSACARRASAVRRAKERLAASRSGEAVTLDPDVDQGELVPAVREEVGDLPEKYRAPLMLCLLDGLTHEQAATRLGWPVGTVKTRVRQAKDRLRTRLTRRGFAPSLGTISAALTSREAAMIPLALIRATVRAALRDASGKALTAGATSAPVATLVELGIGSLNMSRIKIIALVIGAMGALTAGATGYARQGTVEREKAEPAVVKIQEPAKPLAEPPKPVEVSEDDLYVQLENLRIDHDRNKTLSEDAKASLVQAINQLDYNQGQLASLHSLKNLKEFRKSFPSYLQPEDTFESAMSRNEKWMSESVARYQKDEAESRETYHKLLKQLRREEQQIKDLETQLARKTTSVSKDPAIGPGNDPKLAGQADRAGQINSLMLDLDVLKMEAKKLNEEVVHASQIRFNYQDRLRALRGETPFFQQYDDGVNRDDDQRAKETRDSQAKIEAIDLRLKGTRAAYLAKKRELDQLQNRILELDQSPEALAVEPASKTPPTDLERRVADLERKLDLILKTPEARPGGK